ncbi:winged helix-turn-helix domain-containing protein [Chelativorans sp. AA-79]|uniref:response regulator transcription factor n=1 Tax=Chelativorans sp. AA-79 TaxID=3028735 RepID=UPI0023F87493|nr:winged helix-turn-helix domain-containing protein [Chelativorans sp. AA-79]WEX08254.1 winged helix-turn-helix domain-containing protein [Chelativorans sp. AA-79]
MKHYIQENLKIIFIREDRSLWHDMQLALQLVGFPVSLAETKEELDCMVASSARCILVLDLETCANEWLSTIRQLAIRKQVRIVALMANTGAQERLEALKAGVDVYLAKPVSYDELKAVLQRLAARFPEAPSALALDKGRQLLMISGGPVVRLTTLECWFLACLAEAPYRRASRHEVERFLWDDDLSLTDKRLDVLVHRLRKKLETEAPELGNIIATHRSHGFSLLRETHLCELDPPMFTVSPALESSSV